MPILEERRIRGEIISTYKVPEGHDDHNIEQFFEVRGEFRGRERNL